MPNAPYSIGISGKIESVEISSLRRIRRQFLIVAPVIIQVCIINGVRIQLVENIG